MLREATSLGVPLKAWEGPDYVLGLSTSDGLLGFGPVIRQLDPTYVNDFWSKPGYLGTENSALATSSAPRWSTCPRRSRGSRLTRVAH